MREKCPPVPSPDVVTFTSEEYALPVLGLCAECLMSGVSAGNPPGVGYMNRGRAKEVERCRVVTPSGRSMLWEPGVDIPPGGDFLPELARLFGPEASFTGTQRERIEMFAVTMVGGTMLCALHAIIEREGHRYGPSAAAARSGKLR